MCSVHEYLLFKTNPRCRRWCLTSGIGTPVMVTRCSQYLPDVQVLTFLGAEERAVRAEPAEYTEHVHGIHNGGTIFIFLQNCFTREQSSEKIQSKI